MFKEMIYGIIIFYETIMDSIFPGWADTIPDSLAAEKLGITVDEVNNLVENRKLNLDPDGEIYLRSVEKYIETH